MARKGCNMIHVTELVSSQKLIQVTINGGIDDDTAGKFIDALARAEANGQEVLPVYINSGGGLFYSMVSMIDAIQSSRVIVATIGTGIIASAALNLLGFGTKGYRFATSASTAYMHRVQGYSSGNPDEMTKANTAITKAEDTVLKMLAKHCGHKADYFAKLVKPAKDQETYLTAEDLLKHKLIDKVGYPTFRLSTVIG